MTIQLTSANTLMTHSATINEMKLADNFMTDILTLTNEYCEAKNLFIAATLDSDTASYLHSELLRQVRG